MYTIEFKDIERPLLKANKLLKNKKGFNLFEADLQFTAAKENLEHSSKLTIVLSDVDSGLDYIFDNIKVDQYTPGLIEVLETEINTSGDDNTQNLVSNIEKAMNLEKVNQKQNPSTRIASKKKWGFKKKSKQIEKESQNDFADLEDLEASTSIHEEENFSSDFEDVIPQEVYDDTSQQAQDDPMSDFKDIPTEENENEELQYLNDLDTDSSTIEEPSESDIEEGFVSQESSIEDSEIEDSYIEEEETAVITLEKKHERINFPTLASYLDLSSVDSTIKRYEERFDNAHLIKLLGLNAMNGEKNDSELDDLKLTYALNSLEESEFILIKDYFHNNISEINDKTLSHLKQMYERVMLYNFEHEAHQELQTDFDELLTNSEETFTEYESNQEKEYNLKLEKFEQEQEKRLEELKRQLAIERSGYENELETKKISRLNIYKDELQNKLSVKKSELVDTKMYELKSQSINELTNAKGEALRGIEEKADEAMNDIWENLNNEINTLKKDIQERIPGWKQELNAKEKQLAEKREEERKIKALEIEQERNELHRKQLAQKNENQNKENKSYRDLEKKVDQLLSGGINQPMYQQMPQYQYHPYQPPQPIPNQKTDLEENDKVNKDSKKTALLGVLAVGLVGGGLFIGSSMNAAESANTATGENEFYEQLSASIEALGEKVVSPEEQLSSDQISSENEVTLNELLDEKNFSEAVKLFNDKESLNFIGSAIYHQKDIEGLKSFNETHKTTYGELDEAILSRNAEEVKNKYESLSDEAKDGVTKERREDIALVFLQEGNSEYANKVLEDEPGKN